MELAVNKQEELKKQLKYLGSDSYEKEITELKEEVLRYDRQVKNGLEHVKDYSERKRRSITRLVAYKKKNKEEKDFTSDIESILSHPTVINMEVDMENGYKDVFIYTDYIDIYDESGNRFKGNKYKIKFDFNNMSVRFFGEDEEYNRESCWGENCPHPHVSDEGNPCLGDAGSMIAMNMNEYELYASYIIALNFLQQVNVNDGAGEYIYNWDCVDENGNIITNPYENKYVYCSVCDERVHEDDITSCEECGCNLCSEHYWCMDDGAYVCEDCRDENYTYCENCNEWYKNDKVKEANDGNWYCEDCLPDKFTRCEDCGEYAESTISVDDKEYCDGCLENNASQCDNCGDWILHEEGLSECTECGDHFCPGCFNMSKDMCDKCVEESEDK